MNNLLLRSYQGVRRVSPLLYYLIAYSRARRRLETSYRGGGNSSSHRDFFSAFLRRSEGKRCLQVGVKEGAGAKFGPNWISVDKYDKRSFVDYNYDICDLQFEDAHFDAIVCISVLEHVPEPGDAIGELRRVLKAGGEIWVQLPFLFPYHESPKDYWRVTPDGLRRWMRDFDEICCGCDFWSRTDLVAGTFFCGRKVDDEVANRSDPRQVEQTES